MKRFPVESTSLAAVGYDEERRVLEVEFGHGGVYEYHDVPKKLFEELRGADSKGRFFRANVRNAGYRYRRVG